jgi:MFS family permease
LEDTLITDTHSLPPHYRWNFVALIVDYVFFWTAFTFISIPSVLPAFVRQLTDSPIVVGLVSTVFMAGIFLPQLAVARIINDKPLKKPYTNLGLAARAAIPLVAVALWAGLARHPTPMLILFFLCLGIFALGDGGCSVAWFDIIARAIPMNRRGRLYAISQVITGLLGVAIGGAVGLILDSQRLHFPSNYALLFSLASAALIPTSVALYLVREPPPTAHPSQTAESKRLHFRVVLADPAFRRLIACRILVGTMNLAAPFYVGHAQDALHLPERVIGSFVAAQTAAGLIGSIAMGLVSERRGPRYVIRVASAVAIVAPLFALLAHLVRTDWLVRGYPLVYVAFGIVNTAWILGFMNYMLEIAPEGLRPAYIGLGSTMMGVMAVIPTAGGWLLQSTSYPVLFGTTAALIALGWLLSLGLRAPIQDNHTPQDVVADQ